MNYSLRNQKKCQKNTVSQCYRRVNNISWIRTLIGTRISRFHPWVMLHHSTNFHRDLFGSFCNSNKQTDRGENITSLAEVMTDCDESGWTQCASPASCAASSSVELCWTVCRCAMVFQMQSGVRHWAKRPDVSACALRRECDCVEGACVYIGRKCYAYLSSDSIRSGGHGYSLALCPHSVHLAGLSLQNCPSWGASQRRRDRRAFVLPEVTQSPPIRSSQRSLKKETCIDI